MNLISEVPILMYREGSLLQAEGGPKKRFHNQRRCCGGPMLYSRHSYTSQLVAHSRSSRSVSMRKSLRTWKQSVLMLLEQSRRIRMLVGVFSSKPKRISRLLHPSPLCGKL